MTEAGAISPANARAGVVGERDFTWHVWNAIGGPPDAEEVEVTGAGGSLASTLPVEEVAVACVSGALRAAIALRRARGASAGAPAVDRGHVAAAVRSERSFRVDGAPTSGGFAALSRFWRTADGWVRTHANYPWHRQALLTTLGVANDVNAVAAALAERSAQAVEADVVAAGGIAVAVRPLDGWRSHEQGAAVGQEPLISRRRFDGAPPRPREAGTLPASGVRVLDLTRVIAGPVCSRYLGALGADVLRLDPPRLPDLETGAPADTLLGKRSAFLDLGGRAGLDTLHHLLNETDIVACGYRPGSLDRFGLDEDTLVERHPGLVVVYLDAWGHSGPWAARRGFDSVVQAASGIGDCESSGDEPGVLPCQLLDHGTGYLAAAAVLEGLRRQGEAGGTHVSRVSLARTAALLTSRPPAKRAAPEQLQPDDPWLVDVSGLGVAVTAVAPPGAMGTEPLRWPEPPARYGEAMPRWNGRGDTAS